MLHVGMHDECEIFLAESALITQAPSLIELPKGFWVTGLKLKISLGLELSIAFDCIQSKTSQWIAACGRAAARPG